MNEIRVKVWLSFMVFKYGSRFKYTDKKMAFIK